MVFRVFSLLPHALLLLDVDGGLMADLFSLQLAIFQFRSEERQRQKESEWKTEGEVDSAI